MATAVSRRSLLAGAAAALVLPGGCARVPPGGDLTAPAPTPTPTPTPTPPPTIDSLTSRAPFYIAHRGGRRDWPEMTAYAYDQCAALPHVAAIEISVCVSSDGVLVCSHDPTTARVTGTDLEILTTPWSELAGLEVTASQTNDPSQPPRPFSRLDEVLERHLPNLVVFIEPKVPQAAELLKAKLVALDQPARTVWKQPINSREFTWAKAQGFSTWGYALDEPAHSGDRLAALVTDPAIDRIGVEITRSDAAIAEIAGLAAAAGKQTISWSIATTDDRARALSFGCQGLMTAEIRDLPLTPV